MVISAICISSNLVVYNSRIKIVVIIAICMPSNLIVYNSKDMIIVVMLFVCHLIL